MHDSDFPTTLRELCDHDLQYYKREQKEIDKALIGLHTNFALVL